MGIFNFLFGKKEEKVSEIKKPVRVSCDTSVEDYLKYNIEMENECLDLLDNYFEFFNYIAMQDFFQDINCIYKNRFEPWGRYIDLKEEFEDENRSRKFEVCDICCYSKIKDSLSSIDIDEIEFFESTHNDYLIFGINENYFSVKWEDINEFNNYNSKNKHFVYCLCLILSKKYTQKINNDKTKIKKLSENDFEYLCTLSNIYQLEEMKKERVEKYNLLSPEVKYYVDNNSFPYFESRHYKVRQEETEKLRRESAIREQERIQEIARIQIAKRDILESEGYSEDYIRKHMDNIIYNDTDDRDSWSSDSSSSYSSSSDYSSSSSSSSSYSSDSCGGYD